MNAPRRGFRALIYVLPALMDTVLSQVLFVNAVRTKAMGHSATAAAGFVTCFAVSYTLTNLLVARVLAPRNAVKALIAACACALALIGIFPFVGSLTAMYLLVAGIGISMALFFAPFQVFMKEVDAGGKKPLAYSTALYTASWSTGFALGPFLSGLLMESGGADGWKYCYGFSAVGLLMVLGGILFLRRYAEPAAAAEDEPPGEAAPESVQARPDFAWLAWIASGVGVMIFLMIQGVFPARAEGVLGLPRSTSGTILFLTSITQAATALSMCRSRDWMFRPLPLLLLGILGVLGLVGYAHGQTAVPLAMSAVIYGIYSGGVYFYFVFHALAHPEKAPRNAAVNEIIVGVAGMIGPYAGGRLLDADTENIGLPFLCAAGLVGITVLFQAAMHHKRGREGT